MGFVEDAARGRQVGQVVGDRLAGAEDGFQAGLGDAQLAGPLVGQERVEDQDLQHKRLQELDHLAPDHPGAQQADLDLVIAREGLVAEPGLSRILLSQAGVGEISLVGQQDLGERVFRDRNAVGGGGAADLDVAVQEGAGEGLHRSGRVEHDLQIREIAADLVF